MSHRVVDELRWVKRCSRPSVIPRGRPRGAKALGLRYEKAIGKVLTPVFEQGSWFAYEDVNGKGYCQPDFIAKIALGQAWLVIEAKYTWVAEGHAQIKELYRPVLEMLDGLPVFGFVICKRLVPECDGWIAENFEDAVRKAVSGHPRVVLHWIGEGKLWTPARGAGLPHRGTPTLAAAAS